MWVQAAGLFITAGSRRFGLWLLGSILLGIGTAMVYPTLIAAISDASHPMWRARSLSVYRFWRDLGYAIGALIAGVIGDLFGLAWAIAAVGMLTFVSGVIVAGTMKDTGTGKTSGKPQILQPESR
jgi:MFS family permease